MTTSIKNLSKVTSSLQSMIMIANSEPIKEGNFLTFCSYTDRRSEKIISVEGDTFTTEKGYKYQVNKKGVIYSASKVIEFKDEFVGNKNNKELHDEYTALGGKYNHGWACTLIEGVTFLKNVRTVYKNATITATDQSYTDPSF